MDKYKSREEWYFSLWLDDLKELGIVKRYLYESNTFTLSEAKRYKQLKILITKTKIIEKSLMDSHVYTPDFLVEWNKDYDGIFYRTIDDEYYANSPPVMCTKGKKDDGHYTFFEVKPVFDQNNMTRLFRITQKWLYDKYGLYVELTIVPTLFKKTFTPKRYLFTDKATTTRTINFDIRIAEDYLKWLRSQSKPKYDGTLWDNKSQ